MICHPLRKKPFSELRDLLAGLEPVSLPGLPAGLDPSLLECRATRFFKVHVLLVTAEREEQGDEGVERRLLSLRREDGVLVWKWKKGTRTGFWRQSLDEVLEAGVWNAGRNLGLLAYEVDERAAAELDRRMVRVFTPGRLHEL